MKIFVLDTSVLIHDPMALDTFENSKVAIPIFVVMELDELKERRNKFHVAAAARTASRSIISLMEHGSLHDPDGIHLQSNNTTYYIISSKQGDGLDSLQESNNNRKMDLLILSSALTLQCRFPDHRVVLISRDVNLRILANAEGLIAEDYRKDHVSLDELYKGWRCVSDGTYDVALINLAYLPNPKTLVTEDLIPIEDTEAAPNEFFIFEEKSPKKVKRHLTVNKKNNLHIVPKKFPNLFISPKNIEQRMALSLLLDPSVSLVTLIGKAGTGKTYLALASALAQLSSGHYEKILLTKPNIAMGNDIGYLPGSESEKMKPWMQSFFDNLDQLFPASSNDNRGIFGDNQHVEKGWEQLFYSGKIEIQPVYSVRGRSISKAFVIIDEAQNLTPHETKTLITRAAEGTKVILCGDPYQVDRNFMDHQSTGLTYVTKRMRGAEEFGTVYCSIGVRSVLAELAATRL